jgi:hypothetical protein
MKRAHAIILAISALLLASVLWLFWHDGPLDLSDDEEPFRSIVMPPKMVLGGTYMDGGSVGVIIIDRNGAQCEITFPIDYDGIKNAHPTAHHGNINDKKMVPLKDPARAKQIVLRLLRDHGAKPESPDSDEYDGTKDAITALSNPPHVTAARALKRARRYFESAEWAE